MSELNPYNYDIDKLRSSLAEHDLQNIHGRILEGWTNRYINSRLGPLKHCAFAEPYHADHSDWPVSDYTKTMFEADPNILLANIGTVAVCASLRVNPITFTEAFDKAFQGNITDDLIDVMREQQVGIIVGHEVDNQAQLVMHSMSKAIAHRQGGYYPKRRREFAKKSHVMIARGFMPITLGWPRVPIHPRRLTYLGLARANANPHFTLSDTEDLAKAGIPPAFTNDYKKLVVAETLQTVRDGSEDLGGFKPVWFIEPGAHPDSKADEHPEGLIFTHEANEKTEKLAKDMGWVLVAVLTSGLKNGKPEVEVRIVSTPEEAKKLDRPMGNIQLMQAEYRREHGEPNVFHSWNPGPDGSG